jgi:hypothetical protein
MENIGELELISVDKTIFETLENILEAQVRRLAKDIAKTLRVDEKPLLIALQKEKVKTYFYEEDHELSVYDMKCKAYEKEGALYSRCVHPIVFKKEFCVKHLNFHKHTVDSLRESEELYIVYTEDKQEYYFDSNSKIYDRNLNLLAGTVDTEKKTIKIYKLSNTD